jgi:sterol 3beta-glucosyltransferase
MRIILPSIGTRGDVQPYIALALGLLKAGHRVTLATHPIMRGLVDS